MDKAEILQPLYALLPRAVLGSLLILLVTGYLAWRISKNIQKPLVMLFRAAQKAQNGDYSDNIPEDKIFFAPMEIRVLCDTFNIMLGTIREHLTLLQESHEALTAAELKSRMLSIHDQLTRLYNRRYFEEESSRLEMAQTIPLGVVMCDVDGLKIINDTLGHKAGDALICAAARCILESFPPEATVARIGGDEFAVLLPGAGAEEIRRGIEALQGFVARHNEQQPDLPLAISSGGAVADEVPFKLEDIINEADSRMYQEKNQNRSRNRETMLAALLTIAGENDHDYDGHVDGVRDIALELGEALQMDEEELKLLELTAQYHDIGKAGVPKEILTKTGLLVEEEWLKIKLHSDIGARMAKCIPELAAAAEYIAAHHERWDGKGYPEKQKGEEIPLISRIIALADSYDAMGRDTPYRQAMTEAEALREVRSGSGKQFDPQLVDLFLEIREEEKLGNAD